RQPATRDVFLREVGSDLVRRVDENLRRHSGEKPLYSPSKWRVVDHEKVDVARRVRLAAHDRSRGDHAEGGRLPERVLDRRPGGRPVEGPQERPSADG